MDRMPSLATWKEDASGSSISLRSMAESRGSGRGDSPFHLSPGCIRGAGFVFWFGGWVCSCWFCLLGLHLGLLHGICLETIGLLLY